MRRPISIRTTILTALLLALALPAVASAGKYAELGKATSASLFAAQPDGKLLLYGGTYDCDEPGDCASRPFIARLLRSGELDPGFGGGDGIATIPIRGSQASVTAATLLTDGKIVLVGTPILDDGGATRFIARLLPNGRLDRHFGTSGRVRLPSSLGAVQADSLATDSQGRIILVGSRYPGFTVAALLPSGQPDVSFGNGGIVTGDFAPESSSEEAEGLAILGDDRILISGTSLGQGPSYGHYIGLEQLLPNGSPDPAFGGGDGRAIGPGIHGQTGANPFTDDSGGAPVVSDDGITIVGHAGSFSTHQCVSGLLTRFDREGNWDPGYGSDGVQLFQCTYGLQGAAAADGDLLVVAYARGTPRIGRFGADGSPDLDFNRGSGLRELRPAGAHGFGTGVVENGGSSYFSASMTLNPCRSIVRPTADCQVATVTKLKQDGSLDRGFGTAGVASFPPLKVCRRNPLARC